MDFGSILQNLRLQQIFGNGQQPQPTFGGAYNTGGPMSEIPNPMQAQPDDYDAGARMAQLYHPETQNIDKFNQLAGQYPTYQEPGKLRKIGAIGLATLADAFGPQGGGRIAYGEMSGLAPHERQVTDWKNKLAPLEDAANYERQTNNQNRQFATSTVSAEQRQRKDDDTAKNNAEKIRIAEMRTKVYDWKARNPMAKIIAPKGGNIKAINPITGAVIMDFGPAGTMSDKELADLQQTNRMSLQNDAQDARASLQDDQQAAATELEGVRQGNRVTLRGTPTAAGGSQSSTQQRIGEFIRARQVANTDPELAPFIELGDPSSNDFRIMEPSKPTWYGGMSNGPTPEQYKKLQEAIYGPPPTVPKTNVAPPAPAAAPVTKPATATKPAAATVPAPGPSGRASGAGPRGQGGAPPQTAQPLEKTQTNAKTGQKRTLISMDGGKTWQVKQ